MTPCPVCRAKDCDSVRVYQGYTLLHCRSCDLQFSNPMKAEYSFYRTNADYVIRDLLIIDGLRWDHHGDIEYFLKNLPLPGGRLLDVGCGTGSFVNRAIERGFDAFGIDFDEDAVVKGREYFKTDRLVKGDVTSVADIFGQDTFDIITLFQVLEHLEDPVSMIEALRGKLAKGGVLVIALPHRERWPVLGEEWGDLPPHHLTRWSRKAMRGLLDRTGFSLRKEHVESFSWKNMAGFVYPLFLKMLPRATLRGRGIHETLHSVGEAEKGRLLLVRKRKIDLVNALCIPLWIVLRLLGARGPSLYVEAQKA